MTAAEQTPAWPGWAHDLKSAWLLSGPLEVVRDSYLRSGELSAIRVLDRNLRLFEVQSVDEIGKAGIFGWRPGYRGNYIRVRVTFEVSQHLLLAAAKDYIVAWVKSHPHAYDSGIPLTDLIQNLIAARTPEDLFVEL
jgi:hypothetical protein